MSDYNENTAETYDDMVGYISDDNLPKTLGKFFGEETSYEPEIKEKNIDPEFSEPWQTLYVNFLSKREYEEFMLLINHKPVPNMKEMVYEVNEERTGLEKLFGE